MPESFHLLRNNAEVNAASGLRLLRDRGQLVDVSLVCEDGHTASAHRVILASHSARQGELEGGRNHLCHFEELKLLCIHGTTFICF